MDLLSLGCFLCVTEPIMITLKARPVRNEMTDVEQGL